MVRPQPTWLQSFKKKREKKRGCPAVWTGKSPVTETSESAQYLTY